MQYSFNVMATLRYSITNQRYIAKLHQPNYYCLFLCLSGILYYYFTEYSTFVTKQLMANTINKYR